MEVQHMSGLFFVHLLEVLDKCYDMENNWNAQPPLHRAWHTVSSGYNWPLLFNVYHHFTSSIACFINSVSCFSNYTVRYMPLPLYDTLPCMKVNAEKTDMLMRKIQDILHRNVSPKKYSNGQAFRLQQVIYLPCKNPFMKYYSRSMI